MHCHYHGGKLQEIDFPAAANPVLRTAILFRDVVSVQVISLLAGCRIISVQDFPPQVPTRRQYFSRQIPSQRSLGAKGAMRRCGSTLRSVSVLLEIIA